MNLNKIADFFFDNWLGKLTALAGLVTVLITGFAYDQRKVGAQNVRIENNAGAQKLAREMEDAAEPAKLPGAAERLLKHSCSDC